MRASSGGRIRIRFLLLNLLVLCLFIATLPAAPVTIAQEPPADEEPLPDRPENTGSIADQNKARAAVISSSQYRDEVRALREQGARFRPHDVIVNVEDEYDIAAVTVFANDAAYSVTGIFFVDLDDRSVIGKRLITSEPSVPGEASFQVVDDGVVVKDGTVDREGNYTPRDNFDAPESAALCADEGFSAATTCTAIVTALCGGAGGGACWATCAGLALTTGLGGLGCAVICATIGSLGCWGAVSALCG